MKKNLLLDAIHNIKTLWPSVTPQIISNCLKKNGFKMSNQDHLDVDSEVPEEEASIQ